jgi:hypothetical protein
MAFYVSASQLSSTFVIILFTQSAAFYPTALLTDRGSPLWKSSNLCVHLCWKLFGMLFFFITDPEHQLIFDAILAKSFILPLAHVLAQVAKTESLAYFSHEAGEHTSLICEFSHFVKCCVYCRSVLYAVSITDDSPHSLQMHVLTPCTPRLS